jgi:hypothetical protein
VKAWKGKARPGRQAAPAEPVSECRPLEGVHMGNEHLFSQHQQGWVKGSWTGPISSSGVGCL